MFLGHQCVVSGGSLRRQSDRGSAGECSDSLWSRWPGPFVLGFCPSTTGTTWITGDHSEKERLLMNRECSTSINVAEAFP
jgi:hypothetical protein